MATARLLYLHGFASTPASDKALQLTAYCHRLGRGADCLVPAISAPAARTAQQLAQLVAAQTQPICLLGSSLGGLYALWLAERFKLPAILINPALEITPELERTIGPYPMWHTNPYTGETTWLSQADLAISHALVVTPTQADRYWLMTQMGDEVLDYRHAVARLPHAKHTIEKGGDHRFRGFKRHLPAMLAFADLHASVPKPPA